MGRPCKICKHPQRAEIDRVLVRNESGYRTLAKRFGISASSLYRHLKNHLPELIAQGMKAEKPVERKHAPPVTEIIPPAHAEELFREHHALHQRSTEQAIDAVAQLKAINAACLEVLKQARADGKPSILLKAVDRIARQIELQARLLGQIQEGHTINVAVLPEWHGIRQRILEALHPYPDARLAVVRALQGDSTP